MAVTPRPARFREVAGDLRAKIAAGEYPIDSPLPSTAQLKAAYEVSATVIQRAVNELKHERLVEGQPGKAVYVIREPEPAEPSAEYTELMQRIESLKSTVDETFTRLDRRVSELEEAAGKVPRGRRAGS